MFAALLVRQASKIARIQNAAQSIRLASRQAHGRFSRSHTSEDGYERRPTFNENLRNAIVQQAVVDWDTIHDNVYAELVQKHNNYFRGTFTTAVFLALTTSEDFSHLRQFVQHVGLEKLGTTHIVKYMSLCNDPDEILHCWELLKSRKVEFTEDQAIFLADAMLQTPEWREALKLIEPELLRTRPGLASRVAAKYFEEQDLHGGIEVVKFCGKFMSIGKYADQIMENREAAESFLREMTLLESYLEPGYDPSTSAAWSKHFHVKQVVFEMRTCSNCRNALPKGQLNSEQFEKLREAALSKVAHHGGDIYLTSTQEEFGKFLSFVKEEGPFDAVIDGLNLLYRFKEPRSAIETVCKDYLDRGCERILILMRQHVLNLFKKMDLPNGVQFYCVDDISKDDAFVLVAALMSHPDCRMLTSDLFRDHSFHLKKLSKDASSESVYRIFEKWFSTRKDRCNAPKLDSRGRLRCLRVPPQYFCIPHADDGGWHFPEQFKPGEPTKWFCIRRRKTEE